MSLLRDYFLRVFSITPICVFWCGRCTEPTMKGRKSVNRIASGEICSAFKRRGQEIQRKEGHVFAGLKDSLHFENSLIEEAVCYDEIDKAILQLLFEGDSSGLLPKDIAAKLIEFKVARHQVTRQIVRLNKRLAREVDSTVVERRGWC